MKNLEDKISQFRASIKKDAETTNKISSAELMEELNNCLWDSVEIKPYRSLHYARIIKIFWPHKFQSKSDCFPLVAIFLILKNGTKDFTARKISKSLEQSINGVRNLSKKVYRKADKHLYHCQNRRGTTIFETGKMIGRNQILAIYFNPYKSLIT